MLKNKIKTIFIGTPDFGVPSLKSLINDDFFDVIEVITQPDKKIGRKQILTSSPIKKLAQKYNIPVYQPKKLKELDSQIPDIIIIVAYAQIIPESILNIPKFGCINVHGSLLPKHRGASCIQASILNGDDKTGITIMKMDKGLDTGDIIQHKEIKIKNDDTFDSLFDKLSNLGGEVIAQTLKDYISGKIKTKKQDNSKSNYVGLLKKENGKINWNQNAEKIEKHIRAMFSWPGAFSKINNQESKIKTIKIIEVDNRIIEINKHEVGEIFIFKNELAVQCQKDALIIKKIQIEGKKIMTGNEFINGYKKYIGLILS
ncbi:methionyl-tRNA formyltransferase [Candidatus Parcubacteria bacterium]|nr:methionyl-tRNA formyltransferase [Candidatus Parcubacteria bacterium]